MFDLVIVRVLQSLLSDDLDQGLHGLLQILEGKLGEAFVLITQAASWDLILVLILHVEDLRLHFEVLEEGG